MESVVAQKFWIIQLFENFLINSGVSAGLSNILTFLMALLLMALTVWLVDVLGSKLLVAIVHKSAKKTETLWDDFLVERKFFSRIMRLVPMLLIVVFMKEIFHGYNVKFVSMCTLVLNSAIVFMVVRVLTAFLDATNDVYDLKVKERSIKGYVQTAKIILYMIAVILILMMIFDKRFTDLFVGLGASAAIVTLVFKDTILGFVASIQLSAQDMVRKGDWIEIPSKNTDGVVMDINLNSVKVRNWNNTMTMVPIYSLVSEPFTNWRNMEESEGRRFKRPVIIDVNTIRIISQQEITELHDHPIVAPYADQMMSLMEQYHESNFITNIGLYRNYITAYLMNHRYVNEKLPLLVRYTTINENGASLEVYAFSSKKDLLDYEKIVSEIFEHIMVLAPIFKLKMYQHPGGHDLAKLSDLTHKIESNH